MRLPLSLLLVLQAVWAAQPAKRHYSTHDYYVLEHDPRAGASLSECAGALGVEVVEQAGELQDHWLVRTAKTIGPRDVHSDPVLRSLDQLRREAREEGHWARSGHVRRSGTVATAIKHVHPQTLRQRVKRAPPPIRPPAEVETSQQTAVRLGIHDPEFGRQWHLVNDEFPEHMMNVTRVWEMGITGKGVITALVDDGVDYTSDDLAANFYAYGSYDFNDHVDLPTPVLFDDHHGTRCAGQIAALKNDVCGVGIAYESKVAGLRILSGPISDIDEAAALNYDFQNTSIYSCSWGPPDDGRSMEGPSYLIKKAMVNGIQNGRGGKGSVFVFASGNGGRSGDQCNFDGYTNSIFSVTVASIDYKGLHPEYSEPCAANMVVAYSSGSGKHITTTDRGKNKCSFSHGGTSAAAPNAAGLYALALEARPDLTWRDIQHLSVRTAEIVSPDDPDWEDTAAGLRYSYKYGFGRLNGYTFIKAAQTWELVKPQAHIDLPTIQLNNGTMDSFEKAAGGEPIGADGVSSKMSITRELLDKENFGKLEHITVKVWITHERRGDVEVELVSPKGTKSVLAARRFGDIDGSGFPGWTFMTVKHWDEDPVGEWTIHVSDQRRETAHGVFLGWTMSIFGSVQDENKPFKPYTVELVEDVLPPTPAPQAPPSTTSGTGTPTKTLPKPTDQLPTDHGDAEGEAHKPAFPVTSSSNSTASTSPSPVAGAADTTATPTADEGWFSDLSNLVSNQVWFFVALGAVILFISCAGWFFWRRAVRARRAKENYTSLAADDEMGMSSLGKSTRSASGGPQRTKELYDAFGEVSDDEEDADESTGLRPHVHTPGVEMGLHSGFLDDDEPSTAGSAIIGRYRDEPAPQPGHQRADSPGSGSGSSWEHAS